VDSFAFETLEMTLERQRRSRETAERLNEVIAEAIKTGKPVFAGVWGPTGQCVYVSVGTGDSDG